MLVNLNDVLKDAQKNKYAVGLFNTIDTDLLQAAIEAAEALSSPIIIGTAEILLPYGELSLISPSVVAAAKRAKVPVVVHYNHGLTFARCMEALRCGFSSVMYDGSAADLEDNIAATRSIVKIAHAFGASVEAEIGHVGDTDDESAAPLTTPEEAYHFSTATEVDALAIAIGTAHGVYKSKPKLDIERLKRIRARLDTPLVLHGGSGLTDDDFRRCVENGIAKVNIFTDLTLAATRGFEEGIKDGLNYMKARNRKVDAVREEIMRYIRLFGSAGRA
ncbi:MAG TPA: class II fructose-bisphosphate aldolase [Candidatus Gallimonas gallistercoris]|uniref:Class II fructose-bisphosphate aldolase n=1 Tax=Candidatus Gallimonas gallistercoris TaxID=2838602 RepID=A0A9D2H230_9FIRM|nr:class II fructose-bisphosphate aldolase [Candidatus Gallimonas gallistercoris]